MRLIVVMLLLVTALPVWGQSHKEDYDIDDDGLIEISSPKDFRAMFSDGLSATNKTLYGSDEGCPPSKCIGYELTADIDLDDNGDGQITSGEWFRNNEAVFTGVFEGNGFSIVNVYSNSFEGTSYYPGLFQVLLNATVRNLRVEGEFIGLTAAGALALFSDSTLIENCHFKANLFAPYQAGGLVMEANNTIIFNSSFTGEVGVGPTNPFLSPEDAREKSGLVYSSSATQIIASHFSGVTTGFPFYSRSFDSTVVASFADMESRSDFAEVRGAKASYILSRQSDEIEFFLAPERSSTTVSFSELERCMGFEPSFTCFPDDLLSYWSSLRGGGGHLLWDLLTIQSLLQHGDNIRYLWSGRDVDADGVDDEVDSFPFHFAASVDLDGDGKPDQWNKNCDEQCQQRSGLTIDNDDIVLGSTHIYFGVLSLCILLIRRLQNIKLSSAAIRA